MTTWFYKSDDSNCEIGPLSTSELKTMATQGTIDSQMWIRRSDQLRFVRAGQVRGLFNSQLQHQRVRHSERPLPEQTAIARMAGSNREIAIPRVTVPMHPSSPAASIANGATSAISIAVLASAALFFVGCLTVILTLIAMDAKHRTETAWDDSNIESQSPKQRRGEATRVAWEEMRKLEAGFQVSSTADFGNEYESLAIRLDQLATDEIDPELRAHLKTKVETYKKVNATYVAYLKENHVMDENSVAAGQLGAFYGVATSDNQHSDAGAAWGALVGVLTAEVAQADERNQLRSRYSEKFNQIDRRLESIQANEKRIASKLESRYRLKFATSA